VKARG